LWIRKLAKSFWALGGVELEGIINVFPKESKNKEFEDVNWFQSILKDEIGAEGSFGGLFKLGGYYLSSYSWITGLEIVNSSGYSKIWLYALLW